MNRDQIKAAVALKAAAYAYPRQGEGWPANAAEMAAQAAIDAAGVNDLGRTVQEEAGVVAYYAAQAAARKAAADAKATDREAFLASHASPDVVAFVRATQPVTEEEIIRHTGATRIALKARTTGRNAPLATTRRGDYIAR